LGKRDHTAEFVGDLVEQKMPERRSKGGKSTMIVSLGNGKKGKVVRETQKGRRSSRPKSANSAPVFEQNAALRSPRRRQRGKKERKPSLFPRRADRLEKKNEKKEDGGPLGKHAKGFRSDGTDYTDKRKGTGQERGSCSTASGRGKTTNVETETSSRVEVRHL